MLEKVLLWNPSRQISPFTKHAQLCTMVHVSVMTNSMEGEEPLVFHDFLGMACHSRDSVQRTELEMLDTSFKLKQDHQGKLVRRQETAMKSASTSSSHFDDSSPSMVVSGAEQLSWPHGSSGAMQGGSIQGLYPEMNSRPGKWGDGGDLIPQQLHRNSNVPETSPYSKASRIEQSPMQPPRVLSTPQSLHPSFVVRPGLNAVIPNNRWDNSKHLPFTNGMFGQAQLGLLNLQGDKANMGSTRDTNLVLTRPPADEGSRTGLKRSSGGILLSSPPTNATPSPAYTNPSSGRSKSWSQSAASEPLYAASQHTTTPTGRQLTIFYGGQAHVFDDVPSNKADAIMALAGSSGRSWSTAYTSCPKTSTPASGSEGLQSIVDRERSVSKSSAMHCPGVSVPDAPNLGSISAAPRPTENHRGPGLPTSCDSRGMPLMRSISGGEIRKELS